MAFDNKNYINPPIIEALIDIQCSLGSGHGYKFFENALELLGEPFVSRKDRFMWQSGVEFRPGELPLHQSTGGLVGYQFETSDSSTIVQMREDGFTVNKLKPYLGGMTFLSWHEKLGAFMSSSGVRTQ